jgi:hypothetical protein
MWSLCTRIASGGANGASSAFGYSIGPRAREFRQDAGIYRLEACSTRGVQRAKRLRGLGAGGAGESGVAAALCHRSP